MQDHHGTDESPQSLAMIQELERINKKLGATGLFPRGKLDASDEGELRFGINHDADNVIIAFGKPVFWTAMPPAQARAFANALREHANLIERDRGRAARTASSDTEPR